MSTIGVLGTYDTKGLELDFIARAIRSRGHDALLIDVGTLRPPQVEPDIGRLEIAAAAGLDLDALVARGDRGAAVSAMAAAAPRLIAELVAARRINGLVAIGGGGGTDVAASAMRALPIGFPKLIVSTLAGGNVSHYVGSKDIVMFPSIVDVAGLNRVSKLVFSRAAGAICGMVEAPIDVNDDRPIVAATVFGNTSAALDEARRLLDASGYETVLFHATGTGGRAFEALVEAGLAAGVLDLTTTEWADELVGGILGAGPTRLDAAAHARIPAVIAPGCLDMVNFGEPGTVPDRFRGRRFYQHNPQVTLMRTTPDESAQLGRILAAKVNAYEAPAAVVLPLRGLSEIGTQNRPFFDPEADAALFESIRNHLQPRIRRIELDVDINNVEFARICVHTLRSFLEADRSCSP